MVNISITDMPEYKPIERNNGPAYMAIAPPYDREIEIKRFEARYGFLPPNIEVHEGNKNLMLGPVPEKEIDFGEGE